MTPDLSIRQAGRDDLDIMLSWAAGEGWNPGPHDADAFWAADSQGFLLAEYKGEIAGGGTVVAYNDLMGFMGLFIMKPEFRGHGFGRDLWFHRRDTLLGRLAPTGSIGLDAVEAMEPFYASGGFERIHETTRFFGKIQKNLTQKHENLTPLSELPFEQVLDFDSGHFGVPRPGFLKAWFGARGTHALASLDSNGNLLAMGSIRPGVERGFKIGPLFSKTPDAAGKVFFALAEFANGNEVIIDIPSPNKAACDLAQELNLEPLFTCARMYHGKPPPLPWTQIYGLTTFELG